MFLRMRERFEAVMDLVDDILAADPDTDSEPAPSHPHDRTVALRIERRPGSMPPREMHCLCPVHAAPQRDRHTRVGT
jgi:hypothetical protein